MDFRIFNFAFEIDIYTAVWMINYRELPWNGIESLVVDKYG